MAANLVSTSNSNISNSVAPDFLDRLEDLAYSLTKQFLASLPTPTRDKITKGWKRGTHIPRYRRTSTGRPSIRAQVYKLLMDRSVFTPFTRSDIVKCFPAIDRDKVHAAISDGTAGEEVSEANQPPYIYAILLKHTVPTDQSAGERYYSLPAVPRQLVLIDALDNVFVKDCRPTNSILDYFAKKCNNQWYVSALRAMGLRSVEYNETESRRLRKNNPICLVCKDLASISPHHPTQRSTVAHIISRNTFVRLTAMYLDQKLSTEDGLFTADGYRQFEEHIKTGLWHRTVVPLCKAHDREMRHTLWHSVLPSWNPPIAGQKNSLWRC